MNIWDNPQNYVRCKKKLYEIAACMPPVGTVVVNKLEQGDVVQMLGGRTYFTITELNHLKSQNSSMFNTLQQLASQGRLYVVSEQKNVVLAGTMGEMWVTDFATLCKKYTSANGNPIQVDNLKTWFKVRTVPDSSTAFACFVPNNIKGQIATSWGAVLNINGIGASHGKGDFVIAQDAGGVPNLQKRYVINGVIFGRTYNNQGFSKYLCKDNQNNGVTLNCLPKLCDSVKKASSKQYNCLSLVRLSQQEKEDVIKCLEFNAGDDYQMSKCVDQTYYGIFDAFKRIGSAVTPLKATFQRTVDNVREGEHKISFDYTFKGVCYGYVEFQPKGLYFCTWDLNGGNQDEKFVPYADFNSDWLLNNVIKPFSGR